MTGLDQRQEASARDRELILSQLAELRQALIAAQRQQQLDEKPAALAHTELDAACAGLGSSATEEDRGRLLDRLHRLYEPLAGATDVLAKLASVIQAIRGFR